MRIVHSNKQGIKNAGGTLRPTPLNALSPPTSSFTFNPTTGDQPLVVNFTDTSTNGSGTINSWVWDLGDGKTSNAQNPSTTYQFSGVYTIKLTVTDDNGLTSSSEQNLTVNSGSLTGPTASFTVSPATTGNVPFSITTESFSTTGDSAITEHKWTWGDGNETIGGFQNVPHTYNTDGSYTLTLRVTDGNGLFDEATQAITVNAVSNPPPTAVFSRTPSSGEIPLTVDFDANASSDSNGSIVSYAWDFGDGNNGTGVTTSHTYTVAGVYTVTLTVTDNEAATGQTSLSISAAAPGGSGEVISGVIHRTNFEDFSTGLVSASDMQSIGQFEYTTKGFGNGYQNRNLVDVQQDPTGLPTGKWARCINPGGLDAHTFSKAIRAISTEGNNHPVGYEEMWVKIEFFLPPEWATQDQGKLGYSWSNPDGVSPGSNPSNKPEFIYHYFSPNHQKSSGIWPTTKPGLGSYTEQDFVLGLDVYANDSRITNNFSEPIFLVEDADASNFTQKLFRVNTHYVCWTYIKLNSVGAFGNGALIGWWSEDGGTTWKKGVNIPDMDWRGGNTGASGKFQVPGFVRFNGGSGVSFEPGGAPSKNTGVTLTVQDYWYYIKELRTQSDNPFPTIFMV